MQENNFWGNLVKQLREEQKMSQRELAAGARVNRTTLRRIEEGVISGDFATMERLLNHLGYDLAAMCKESKPLMRGEA